MHHGSEQADTPEGVRHLRLETRHKTVQSVAGWQRRTPLAVLLRRMRLHALVLPALRKEKALPRPVQRRALQQLARLVMLRLYLEILQRQFLLTKPRLIY